MKNKIFFLLKIIFAVISLMLAISIISTGICSGSQPYVVKFLPAVFIILCILTIGNLFQDEIDNKNNK